MTGPASAPRPAPGGLAWIVIAAAAAVDQASKAAAERVLPAWHDPRGVEVFEGLLYLHYKRNTGVAFSLFAEHPEILAFVTTAAVLLIGWWAWQVPRSERAARFAFGLVLGGALGNLIDRWLRGYVVDFFDFIFPGLLGRWHERWFGSPHFATFNVADSCITIGVVLLILSLLFAAEPAAPGPEPDRPDPA